jgi:hypothetical protein
MRAIFAAITLSLALIAGSASAALADDPPTVTPSPTATSSAEPTASDPASSSPPADPIAPSPSGTDVPTATAAVWEGNDDADQAVFLDPQATDADLIAAGWNQVSPDPQAGATSTQEADPTATGDSTPGDDLPPNVSTAPDAGMPSSDPTVTTAEDSSAAPADPSEPAVATDSSDTDIAAETDAPQPADEDPAARSADSSDDDSADVDAIGQEDESASVSEVAADSSPEADTSDFSAQDITDADCTNKTARGPNGNVINHFNYCSSHKTGYRVTEGNEVVGQAIADVRNRGWASKNKREVSFVLDVSSVEASGALNKQNTKLELSETCLNAGCEAAAANKARNLTLSDWEHHNGAHFTFSNRKSQATAPHYFLYGDFYPHLTFRAPPFPTRSANGTENTFRCDSDVAFASTRLPDGCIFNRVLPFITLSMSDSKYGAEARHVFTALNHPDQTYPKTSGKNIPDVLNRVFSKSVRDKNTRAAVRACRAAFGKDYSKGKTLDCDEYPFQSAQQGAASGPNFSVRPIAKEQNRSGGARLSNFYTADRIADGDQFRVKVIS